jgi:hypothetical protein
MPLAPRGDMGTDANKVAVRERAAGSPPFSGEPVHGVPAVVTRVPRTPYRMQFRPGYARKGGPSVSVRCLMVPMDSVFNKRLS